MVCVYLSVRLLLFISFTSHVLGTVTMFVCLSIRPGPETHTFSFQVSRNERSVCLRTWGRGKVGHGTAAGAGQGRAVIFIIEHIKKTRIFLKKKKEKKKKINK